jgi:hypothetical protein
MYAAGNQSGDVRHVHKKECADGLGDFGDALEIDDARICAGTRYDHFGFVILRERFDLIVIDALIFLAHVIFDEVVHAPGKIQRVAVGQVAAVREGHAEDGVAGFQRRHIYGNVGGRAGVRLHISVFRAE